MSLLIDLRDVTKTYYAADHVYPVLKGVDFSLQRGEMAAVMGASGSGKSTLMNVLGFLDRCTSGQYYFDGHDVSALTEHELTHIRNRKIGFVFQSFYLLPRLTILNNVMLPLFYREEPEHVAREKALAMLTKMGMEAFADRRPNQLSGGQQQRVAIARALVGDPDVILADEPTGSLDLATGQTIMDILRRLHQDERRTILLITHDEAVSRLCQRTVLMRDGLIVTP